MAPIHTNHRWGLAFGLQLVLPIKLTSSPSMLLSMRNCLLRPNARTSTTLSRVRHFASDKKAGIESSSLAITESSTGTEWRKLQLDRLERKFARNHDGEQGFYPVPPVITDDDNLQTMWKNMESRVKNRRPRETVDAGDKRGRQNLKKTDEEVWLKEGLYNHSDDIK